MQFHPSGPGDRGIAAGYVTVGERGRVIAANTTFDTNTVSPLWVAGYPRISFYILVVAGAAGLPAVLEQVSIDALQGGGIAWDPLQNSYAAALNTPLLNGAAAGHVDGAFIPCIAARMRLTTGADQVTCNWYIAASL